MLIHKVHRDKTRFKKALKYHLPYKPLFVKLKLTWNCNLKCLMCNHWRERVSDMPLDFFKDIVTQLATLGTKRIHLTGGEPLLYPHFMELAKFITSFPIKLTMTSNGTLLYPKVAQQLANLPLSNLNVSIDSPDPELHDHIRGIPNAFQRTIRAIKTMRPLLNAKIQINMVVNPRNYHTVKDLPDLAHEIGADRICLIPIKIRTNDLPPFSFEQLLDFNENIAPIAFAKAAMYGLVKHYKQIYIFGTTEQELQNSTQGLYAQGYYDTHPCYALWTHALIDHEGRVSACCFANHQPVIGDLKQHSFYEIWTSTIYQQLRNLNYAPLNDCKSCTMFLLKNEFLHQFLEKK